MQLSKRVKQIAKEVRKRFEHISKNEGFAADLACLCYRASFTLVKRLKAAGFKARLAHGKMRDTWGIPNYHAWVVYNNLIIDLTATQFGYRNKIFVRKCSCKLYGPKIKLGPKSSWPENQLPMKTDYVF